MEETLEREFTRARRHETSVALISIGLDHFKTFNDRYGHGVGDDVLRTVGDFLKRHVRASDVACRLGGEEFLVVLPDASCQAALTKAQEVHAAFKGARVEASGGGSEAVTLSMGVASFPSTATQLKMFFERLIPRSIKPRQRAGIESLRHPLLRTSTQWDPATPGSYCPGDLSSSNVPKNRAADT
jgi:diguanylate cyclase (GGDEF)-like protein